MVTNINCILIWSAFVLLFAVEKISANNDKPTESVCGSSEWIAFQDEKCFKIIKELANHSEAQSLCKGAQIPSEPYTPTLVSINSQLEQEFLTEFVCNTSGVNVWIGAQSVNKSVAYTNWPSGSPTENTKPTCVVMKSGSIRAENKQTNKSTTKTTEIGQWISATCGETNYVLCEKLQSWTFVQFQEIILNSRKELKQSLLDTRKELDRTKTELESTNNLYLSQLEELKNATNLHSNQLEELKKNPVPIGFIYTQLPNQAEPNSIWPNVKWSEVTGQYAGKFFRAEGDGSEAFGQAQGDNSPRLVEISPRHGGSGYFVKFGQSNVKIIPDQWSRQILTGQAFGDAKDGLSFLVSGGEVRPKNMAFRVWKRIA